MKTKILLALLAATAITHAAEPKIFPNGLDDWKNGSSEFGRWIATNNRIALVKGKYQPQFQMPATATNQIYWNPLFEGDASDDELPMAQFKLRWAWQIKKAVQDELANAFRGLAEGLTPKTNAHAEPIPGSTNSLTNAVLFISASCITNHFGVSERAFKAMGIDWMNGTELSQAIPQAYSEFLARQIIPLLK